MIIANHVQSGDWAPHPNPLPEEKETDPNVERRTPNVVRPID